MRISSWNASVVLVLLETIESFPDELVVVFILSLYIGDPCLQGTEVVSASRCLWCDDCSRASVYLMQFTFLQQKRKERIDSLFNISQTAKEANQTEVEDH